MRSVLTCVTQAHDHRLIALAVLVCTVGVYACFAVGAHAVRQKGREGRLWGATSLVAAGCTAWATHFLALMSFRPGVKAAFEPVATAASLLCAVVIIGCGFVMIFRARDVKQRFLSGAVIGCGVAVLHYLGQMAYVVAGHIEWDWQLVVLSVPFSIALAGTATLTGTARNRTIRHAAAPLLLLSIAVLHFSGMTAASIRFDPTVSLPLDAVAPEVIAPVVAGVCFGLLVLAIVGFRFSRAAKARIRFERNRLHKLADVALEGLLICDGGAVVTTNSSFVRLSGMDRSASIGLRASAFFPYLDLSSLPEHEERETQMLDAEGGFVPVCVLRSEVPVGRTTQTVYAVRDQRERLRTEARLRTLAFNDTLTGLPNRSRFHDLLELHAHARIGQDLPFAVLIVDLDRFKPVNDMLGHAAGDLLLRKAAERLRSIMAGDNVVARLGGDEFAVLVSDARDPASCGLLAERCIEVLSKSFMLDDQPVYVGASVGIAMAPADGTEPADLLHAADLALYAAKTGGKGTFRKFDPELDARMRERRLLEAGLRQALAEDQFELHYQPLVETSTRQVTSAEALVRWRHPERGLVPPADFIPLAEETGLIVALGAWVLRTACAEAATWPSRLGIAVNLSPVQFRNAGLISTINEALAAAGLEPSRLELEITEGVLLDDEQRTLAILNELRSKGVRISMDDFGTGYSSLNYLRRFPFDKIKVDRSFIRQLPADAESAAIVRAIITMGACLGITTTVEGVETSEQYDFTVAEGCQHVQGYLVSRPLPSRDFATFLRTTSWQKDSSEQTADECPQTSSVPALAAA